METAHAVTVSIITVAFSRDLAVNHSCNATFLLIHHKLNDSISLVIS